MPQRGRRVPSARTSARPQPLARNLPWNLQIVQAERQATIESLGQQPTTSRVIAFIAAHRSVPPCDPFPRGSDCGARAHR